MALVLLTSENYIKSNLPISDNLSGKYLQSAIREAQEIGLRGILGSCLLNKLKNLVDKKEIDKEENAAYKELVSKCQDYLAYMSVVEVINRTSYKIGNFGLAKSSDENLQVVTEDEIAKQKFYYQGKADAYCFSLQSWLLDNKKDLPELDDCSCGRIQSQLHSAATCGFFLGGARGKRRVK